MDDPFPSGDEETDENPLEHQHTTEMPERSLRLPSPPWRRVS